MNTEQFKIDRVKKLKKLYESEPSAARLRDQKPYYKSVDFITAAQVRAAMWADVGDVEKLSETSRKLYAANPIYASIINYLANMYMWRYKVIPHKVYTKSKAKLKKQPKEDDFMLTYNTMLEVVDGLSIETKFPALLSILFTTGSVYFTTVCDEETLAIDTILLPTKYCRQVGQTQFGTSIIEFDFTYFDQIGSTAVISKEEYLKTFPAEFIKLYHKFEKDRTFRWQVLDPHFTSGLMLNDVAMPTFFYLYGGILDYEHYQDNELERNENLLKYIVVHTMPHYEDKLIFEVDEVDAIHKSLKKIVETGEKARLITTYGDVHVDKISENDTSENEVLSKAFKAIFNNAGFNSGIFTSESVQALKMSLIRDKGYVWKFVQALSNFYSITINNWFDFKDFQADIDILPISTYTYDDDIKVYKDNATLGVDKLGYLIASGVKQKNIQDNFNLEKFLKLDQMVPMQTSYTQTAEDRSGTSGKTEKENEETSDSKKDNVENEPSTESEVVENEVKSNSDSE